MGEGGGGGDKREKSSGCKGGIKVHRSKQPLLSSAVSSAADVAQPVNHSKHNY